MNKSVVFYNESNENRTKKPWIRNISM